MPINNPVLFQGEQSLGTTAGAPLSTDANNQLISGITNSEVSATADATTTSATDVLMTGMTITPVAGDYMVWFSCSMDQTNQVIVMSVSIYSGGVQLAHSVRGTKAITNAVGAQSMQPNMATQGKVTVNGAQAIEIRWNRGTAGTATVHQRSMFIQRLS